MVAGLVRDGEVVWRASRGSHAGVAVGDPFDVQYRLGSITKTFTAVLVHQLVVDGLVGLDEPVSRVLGEVGYADRTVRSLLAHDSGMQAEPFGPWWEASPGGSWAELVTANDGSETVFPAHQQFHYSNLGYAMLGEVVARLRGRPWWECVEERILTPLGMSRTTYLPEAPSARGFSVHPYAGTLADQPATDTGAMAPAGQAWASLDDTLRWAAFLLTGHPDVLPLPGWWRPRTRRPATTTMPSATPTASGSCCSLAARACWSGTPARCPASWPPASPTGNAARGWPCSPTPRPGCP